MSTKELIRSRFEEAKAELAAHEQKVAPARAALDKAAADYEAARIKWETTKADLVPKLDKAAFVALSGEIATLATALGGKRMGEAA